MTRIEFMNSPAPANNALPSQINLFAVPLLSITWPEASAHRGELLAAIAENRAKSKGVRATNAGGWHSERDLPVWPGEATRALFAWAAAMATHATASWRLNGRQSAPTEWRMNGWANVNPPGAYNTTHDHVALSWNWTGCYYVAHRAVEEGDIGGAIVFHDRWIGLQTASLASTECRKFRYQPTEGELLLWPSWLPHQVEPHTADNERVSIAMNFHSPWLERSRYWTHRPGFFWRHMPALMRPIAHLRGGWDQSPNGSPPGYDITADPRYL